MNINMVTKEEGGERDFSESPVVFRAEDRTVHQCVCGRTECCGKHKNGQCACKKEGRVHD